jgi:DNA-binding transcriptional LysR family regulator
MSSSTFSKADLHLLRVFTVVVDSKGFSTAQVALNVSTSTISRQITDLETRLGMQLCQRGRTGFRITDKGKTVYHAAQKLFLSLDEFQETVNGSRGSLVGNLSLGVIDNWISNDTAPIVNALAKFTKAAEDVSIELHSMAPDDIEYAVLDGRISIGVGVFHTPKPGLLYQEIGQEFIGLYCGFGHPLFQDTSGTVHKNLLQKAKLARRAYLNEEKVAPVTHGLASNVKAHQVEGIALLILTGNFIGYLPQSFANMWVKDGRMKSVAQGQFDLPTPIKTVTKRGEKLNLVSRTFIEYLETEAPRASP